MRMIRDEKNKTYFKLSGYLIVFAIIISAIIFLIELLNGKSRLTSTNKENVTLSSLSCSVKNATESFFNDSKADSAVQNIKIIFNDGRTSNIMYTLDTVYDNADEAKLAKSNFFASYEEYMSRNGLDDEIISADFASTDTKTKVKLYTEYKNLNSATSKLFLLDSRDLDNTTLQQIYESKGFVCDYKSK